MANQWRRASQGAVFGGVCAGLAHMLGMNVVLMRVLWVLAALFTWSMPVFLLYIVLWAALPMEDDSPRTMNFRQTFMPGSKGMLWLGIILLGFGAFLLAKALLPINLDPYMLPIGLILVGVLVVWGAVKAR